MRNYLRAAWFGFLIALMCDVLIVTLAYVYKQLAENNLLALRGTDLVTNPMGWIILILTAVFMSRTILRTVIH
jgi:hypothetical protein